MAKEQEVPATRSRREKMNLRQLFSTSASEHDGSFSWMAVVGARIWGEKTNKTLYASKNAKCLVFLLCSCRYLSDSFNQMDISTTHNRRFDSKLNLYMIFSIFKANLDKQQLNYCGNLCFKPNMVYSRFKATILLYSVTATPWMKKCVSWIPSFNHNSKIFYIYCSLSVKLLPRWGKDQIISMDVN